MITGVPNDHQLDAVVTLYQILFKDAQVDFFIDRIKSKEALLSILAYCEAQVVGFKTGYRYNNTTFYSWVGGVHPLHRKQGIATKLAQLQESWVRENKFKKIRTKSMNRYKPMMILNLKNGFNIIDIYTNDVGQTKLIFEKIV